MKIILRLLIITFIFTITSIKLHAALWSYDKINQWEETCEIGEQQSPINLDEAKQDKFAKTLNYENIKISNIVNNGHTIQLNFEPTSSMIFEGKEYKLVQIHFHAPSEHTIKGQEYAMEGHFVHQAEDESLAVIGVLFKIGKENPTIQDIITTKLVDKNKFYPYKGKFNLNDLFPTGSLSFYTYPGSLTTPPCTEGVKWIVMAQELTVSSKQVEEFKKIFNGDTNRPVQPVNDRSVKFQD